MLMMDVLMCLCMHVVMYVRASIRVCHILFTSCCAGVVLMFCSVYESHIGGCRCGYAYFSVGHITADNKSLISGSESRDP